MKPHPHPHPHPTPNQANFIWVLVGVKFLHDWKPDLIPGPKEMGLFKIWGIV